jgi:hypothetical protein
MMKTSAYNLTLPKLQKSDVDGSHFGTKIVRSKSFLSKQQIMIFDQQIMVSDQQVIGSSPQIMISVQQIMHFRPPN